MKPVVWAIFHPRISQSSSFTFIYHIIQGIYIHILTFISPKKSYYPYYPQYISIVHIHISHHININIWPNLPSFWPRKIRSEATTLFVMSTSTAIAFWVQGMIFLRRWCDYDMNLGKKSNEPILIYIIIYLQLFIYTCIYINTGWWFGR